MPDLCRASGASPNPIFGGAVSFTAAGLEGIIAVKAGPQVAAVVAPLLALFNYSPNAICSQVAPADPGLTQLDIVQALDLTNPLIAVPAGQKVLQWFLSFYWSTLCVCNDGQPPAPVTTSQPVPPSLNPGGGGGVPGTPCWDVHLGFTYTDPPATSDVILNGVYLPVGTVVTNPTMGGGFNPGPAVSIPQGISNILATTTVSTAGHTGADIYIVFFNSAATFIGFVGLFTQNDNTVTNLPVTIPANSVYWSVHATTRGPGAQVHVSGEFSFTCAGQQPGGLAVPCCPPDPLLQSTLTQIYQLLTLVQRQTAAFAYVPGTTHTGLTGSGEFPVQGLIGMKLAPSAIPPNYGQDVGDPDTLWLDSWYNWGNADGWLERSWLRTSPQLTFPPEAGTFTRFGYSLAGGLVVDVTELKREP